MCKEESIKEIFNCYQESARRLQDLQNGMKKTKMFDEKENFKLDIEKLKADINELNKTYRRSFRKLINLSDEQQTWDILRRLAPHQYFTIINTALKLKDNGQLMIHFKSKINEGSIEESRSLSDYI